MTKEEKREYNRKRYQTNREKILEQKKQYNQANKEKLAEYKKEYYQANKEKIKEQRKEYDRKYYQKNKEKCLEQMKKWRETNKEKFLEYLKEYYKTPIGRASMLLSGYNKSDKKANRGKGDLTAKWIVENIFSKPCKYCGKEGWDVIGCNRIDNSKPHSKDNVEPCCRDCNVKLPRKS